MNLDELWSLHEEISSLLADRIQAEKLELEKRLAVLHRGIASPEEQADAGSLPVAKRRRKYPRVLPKYRNPVTGVQTCALPIYTVILKALPRHGLAVASYRGGW